MLARWEIYNMQTQSRKPISPHVCSRHGIRQYVTLRTTYRSHVIFDSVL